MLEALLAVFGEVFFELFVDVVLWGLFELLFERATDGRRITWLGSALFAGIFGMVLGGGTLQLRPQHAVHDPDLQLLLLFLVPLLVGGLFAFLTAKAGSGDSHEKALTRFATGAAFLFCLLGVRQLFAAS